MLTNEYLVLNEHRRRNQRLSKIDPIRTHFSNHSQPKNQSWLINGVRSFFSKSMKSLVQGLGLNGSGLSNHQLPLGITTLETGKAYNLPPHRFLRVISGTLLVTRNGIDMILRPGSSLPISASNYAVLALVLGKTQATVELKGAMPDNPEK